MTRMIDIGLIACAVAACMGPAGGAEAQETTWESPPISTQLEQDDTIIPVGKGAVFVPSMTPSDNEPNYGVLDEGGISYDAPTGHRLPLSPGVYTIVHGSGTIDQMIKTRVRVEENATTLIKPSWAGLVIEVIDQSRANIREYYELFDLRTGVSYGIGQGVEEGLDEELRTWILPPGVYKIVKPGDNVNAVVNFGTISLNPGELVRAQLVLDSTSGNFLGFGRIAAYQLESRSVQKWRTRNELSGNALLNYEPTNESGGESGASFTSTMQLLTDARYESGRHVVPVWFNLEEGLSMQSDRVLHKYTDKAELKLTYIYRLTDYLNPYVRTAGETRLFSTYHRFDEPTDYFRLDAAGDTLGVVENADNAKLGNGFSPINLREGFGVTSTLFRSVPVNFNLRTGYGARQNYGRSAFIFNTDNKTLIPIEDSSITGMEMLFIGDVRIGGYILIYTEFDMLMPEANRDSWVYDSESRLRLNLSSHVSLLFKFEFWRDETVTSTQTRFQTLLRFSRFF